MKKIVRKNDSLSNILINCVIITLALVANGFGIYLTIKANLGAGPWDVLNQGVSKTFGILFGNASVIISFMILGIDLLLKEPIGIAIFIDSIVVGKAIDMFNYLEVVKVPSNFFVSLLMLFVGLVIIGYTQYLYMLASLGCGARDTLLVGLKKRIKSIPIGVISICILTTSTVIGHLLGGQIGIGTLINAFAAGPIMQKIFEIVKFDATTVRHQHIPETLRVITKK